MAVESRLRKTCRMLKYSLKIGKWLIWQQKIREIQSIDMRKVVRKERRNERNACVSKRNAITEQNTSYHSACMRIEYCAQGGMLSAIQAFFRLVTHKFVHGACRLCYLSLSFGLKHKRVAAPAWLVRIQKCSNPRQSGRGNWSRAADLEQLARRQLIRQIDLGAGTTTARQRWIEMTVWWR